MPVNQGFFEIINNFDLKISISTNGALVSQAKIIIATYAENGSLIDFLIHDADKSILESGEYTQHIAGSNKEISEVKIFIWNSLYNISPLAECYVIN